MMPGPRCQRIVFFSLIAPLLLAIPLAGQQDNKQAEMSLTVEPSQITLNAGQSQKFSATLKGAPAGTVINWAVRESGGNVTQDGVFTARIVGIYHVVALATRGNSGLMQSFAKVTVVTHYDGPAPR